MTAETAAARAARTLLLRTLRDDVSRRRDSCGQAQQEADNATADTANGTKETIPGDGRCIARKAALLQRMSSTRFMGNHRGTQYVSMRYTDRLSDSGIAPPIGGRAGGYDSPNGYCALQRRHRPGDQLVAI